MTKIVLEKGKYFDLADEHIKKELLQLFEMKFKDFKELIEELYKPNEFGICRLPFSVYLPKNQRIEVSDIPFTIKEWPLLYEKSSFSSYVETYEIAKVKVVE